MAVATFSAEDAYRNLKRRASLWPDGRVGDERLSGLVRLELNPSFGFSRDDRILALGSCFARSLETRLHELGFEIPIRRSFHAGQGGAEAIDPAVLTKFTIQSIENELRWASGEPAPDPETLFLQVADGRWHDPQLIADAPALPLEEAVRRRKRIEAAVGRFPMCRIVIVTLGLAEAWFDEESGLYLNVAPPPAAVRRHPGRFALHVLDSDEILGSLERLHAILRQKGHPDVRMLVTVSPIPFKATFSGEDVIAANTYSKAAQRAACRAFVQGRAGVDYFPSYEMVTQSPRELAFEIDNLHVADAMVRHVMNEVLGAYAPEIPTAPVSADVAGSRRGEGLGGHFDQLAAAKHLNSGQRYAEAAVVCEQLLETHAGRLSPADLSAARSVYAAALLGQERWDAAATQLELAAESDPRGGEVFYKLGQCHQHLSRYPEAVAAYRQAVALDSARPEFRAHLEQAEALAKRHATGRGPLGPFRSWLSRFGLVLR